MTNAIYKEDGKIHLTGYFGANDNNKTATKNLYWRWKLETGTTQAEINANDILDSQWMGERILLGVQATGRQVGENPMANQYAVTFDANGGTLQDYGDSSQTTKMVTYGEEYGDLPTPTREGYTFMGWNGKNLININAAVNDCLIDNGDETYTMWYNDKGRFGNYLNVYIKGNISLTMSYDLLEYNGTYSAPLQIYSHLAGGKGYLYFGFGGNTKYTEYDIDKFQIYQESSQPVGTYTKFKNLQLEKGSIATAYEPYYITTSTEVVQNQDHTLTAIWEPNE